jgi:phosphonate transport system substrate-binding protein
MIGRGVLHRGLVAVLAILLGAAACDGRPAPTRVSFARRTETPSVRPAQDSRPRRAPLRVAVAAILSPTRTLEAYHDLLTYMGQRLGHPVQLIVQRATYAEINDLLKNRAIDVAFVCGGALPTGERDFGMQVMAVPQIRGTTAYYSYLIVNRRSALAALGDLRGKSFAFTDPLSTSGRMAPVHELARQGQTPERFFGRTVFTRSHDNSILAVADGVVDGAAVGSLVYDYLRARDPDAVRDTRVVARWGPYGNPPVVVHPDLDPALRAALKELLLSIHVDSYGRHYLDRLLIDRFVDPSPDLFDSIRTMEARARRR